MKQDEIIPAKPTEFFNFLIEKRWSYFLSLDPDDLTNNQMSIVALIKACRAKNLKAIRVAMNRIDGKLAVVVDVEAPKFLMEFPNAPTEGLEVQVSGVSAALKQEEEHIPTTGLRNTLRILGRNKTTAVTLLLEMAEEAERLDLEGIVPPESRDPFVKSIIMACLMSMGRDGDLSAIFEILDTIDGVVADKIKLLGDDVVIQSPSLTAPAGAYLSPEGVATVELPNQSRIWGDAMAAKRGLEVTVANRLGDGDEQDV